MGDMVFANSTSVFDSAFKHDYNSAQTKPLTQPQTVQTAPAAQPKQQQPPQTPQNLGQLNADVYNALRISDLKPYIDNPNQAVVDTVITEPKNNREKLKAAAILGTTAVAIGGTSLLLTKGNISKSFSKLLSKNAQDISNKIVSIKSNPHQFKKSELQLSLYQKINKALMMTRGLVFNITPIKDVLFDKIVCDFFKLRKPCNAITRGFRTLSLNTVKKGYKNASSSANAMTRLFAETNQALESGQIQTANPLSKTTLDLLKTKTTKIGAEFDKNFSENAITNRDDTISGICKDLNKRVFNRVFGNFKYFVSNLKSWTTFIPEALISNDKTKFLNSLLNKKRIITNGPKDNFLRVSDSLSTLEKLINPNDKASRETLSTLRELSQKYINASGENKNITRTEICSKINELLKTTKKSLKKTGYTAQDSKDINTHLDKIGKVINNDKKGLIEELLTIYKGLLPPDEYNKLKIAAQKTIKNINKATKKEGEEYIDKVRDLTDGAALTDIAFSMALPIATTAIAVSTAKTKEKKQSVTLKYGIPIISGAITSMIATVKLVTGGKALALGLLSTLATNQICGRIDKHLKSTSSTKS